MEIVITTEEKGFSASIEKLHIHTQGDSFDELLVNISECIELFYEEEKDHMMNNMSSAKFYFSIPKIAHAN